jgi:hypothetical protein
VAIMSSRYSSINAAQEAQERATAAEEGREFISISLDEAARTLTEQEWAGSPVLVLLSSSILSALEISSILNTRIH